MYLQVPEEEREYGRKIVKTSFQNLIKNTKLNKYN